MSKLIRKSNKGFTLIELMIVVAIIGILAAIAIPNFLRFQLKAKSSEGKVNIAAIRTAEESFQAEFGAYVSVPVQNPATINAVKQPFVTGTTLNAAGANFETLGWAPEGQVFFQYAVAFAAATPTAYTITATADIDANTTNQSWGYVKPVVGTTSGIAGVDTTCVLTGLPNPAGGTALLTTVGPCAAASGQSVF
jgi:type IV pilus assembly protein PilA